MLRDLPDRLSSVPQRAEGPPITSSKLLTTTYHGLRDPTFTSLRFTGRYSPHAGSLRSRITATSSAAAGDSTTTIASQGQVHRGCSQRNGEDEISYIVAARVLVAALRARKFRTSERRSTGATRQRRTTSSERASYDAPFLAAAISCSAPLIPKRIWVASLTSNRL
eukprot:720401-Pleurochrysis_carterae.AAC.4